MSLSSAFEADIMVRKQTQLSLTPFSSPAHAPCYVLLLTFL
jgi:hypothetical protein